MSDEKQANTHGRHRGNTAPSAAVTAASTTHNGMALASEERKDPHEAEAEKQTTTKTESRTATRPGHQPQNEAQRSRFT